MESSGQDMSQTLSNKGEKRLFFSISHLAATSGTGPSLPMSTELLPFLQAGVMDVPCSLHWKVSTPWLARGQGSPTANRPAGVRKSLAPVARQIEPTATSTLGSVARVQSLQWMGEACRCMESVLTQTPHNHHTEIRCPPALV